MVEDDGTKPVRVATASLERLLTLSQVDMGERFGPLQGGHEHGYSPRGGYGLAYVDCQ